MDVAPLMTPDTPAAAAPRVAAAVDAWKRKLLDLSKRNRALAFKPTKVSTVTVVGERPAEVWRRLVAQGKAMRFAPAPETGPNDPAPALEADATDDVLQTTAPPEALDHSLRRLDEQARASIEEQGVGTLFLALGMMHYTESDDSAQVLRAPLVMVPVSLTRKSARAGYTVRVTDDDPLVNPALAEYLRRDFGLVLPELPDAEAPEGPRPGAESRVPSAPAQGAPGLDAWLAEAARVVAAREGWAVRDEIVLALFSFQKLAMYKDLEANADALARHPQIVRLVTRDGGPVIGLPDEIRAMDLDVHYPPETTFQVVDADASQLRAIAAVARGHDLVIEGPPGTGKSQTITNLVASALASGKRVLFVAEKMAALSVVHDRLARAGLAEFCLEVHSTKANKRAVMKELAATLDASLERVAAPTASTERLPKVRAALDEYAAAVHTPAGTLGATPYHGYGELARVRDAPRVRLVGEIDGDGVTRDALDQAVRDLHDLAAAASEVGAPAEHPWRDTTKTFYAEDDLDEVRRTALDLVARLDDLRRRAAAVRDAFGIPAPETFAEVEAAGAVGELMARSPGAPLAVLEGPAWAPPPHETGAVVERLREYQRLRARMTKQLREEALDQEHAEDIAWVERKASGALGFLALLDGRYRAIRARWVAYRLPTYRPSMLEQANEMKQVDRLLRERRELRAMEEQGRRLFGDLWHAEESDYHALEGYVRWVAEMQAAAARHHLLRRALEVAATPRPDVAPLEALTAAGAEALGVLARLRALVGWPPESYLGVAPFPEIASRARALADTLRLAPRWAAFEAARREVQGSLAREMLAPAMAGEVPFGDLAAAFLRAFWSAWLAWVVRSRPALERFHTMQHEERVAEFRALDRRVLEENRAALVAKLRDRVQAALREPEAAAALPFLRREMARQRGLSPLRRTVREAGAAVRAIKPCWMMSPLTVAQLIGGDAPAFDLVIFDEASQLPPEDAVGAVARGRGLVVVGDPKQLPPTNFFAVQSGMAAAETGEDGEPLYDDAESILEEYMGAGIPMSRLRWHYRSAHESLITFSNVSFYDADLHTFPSVETSRDRLGVQLELVAEGVYQGQGLNLPEARRVAEAVMAFAREGSGKSLGVGTFSLRQQLAVLDEVERLRREDATCEPFFDRSRDEPFFVKNLENIQGDERDVVFLSVTYGRSPDGRLRMHFGPLNGDNGWRRLNVLATRARERMRVFASMRGDDIPAASESKGARLLRDFLRYAETGRLESPAAAFAAESESFLERDVASALERRGLRVVPQVGDAGYRIDLGVLDDALPGRFLCGIECDGAAYHASETARDRDRLRQQVLEARGWTIHRVWSTDWFKDREGQIERLVKLVEVDRSVIPHERAARVSGSRDVPSDDGSGSRDPEIPTGPAGLRDDEAPDAPSCPPRKAPPYRFAPGEDRYAGDDLLEAPMRRLVEAVSVVVEAEAPVHEADVVARVVGMWDTRAGSRIQARIREALDTAERGGLVRRRGEFLWTTDERCVVRSRAGTRIPADRIAPEEYRRAVLDTLAGGEALPRDELVAGVRALLGYARTGPALDEAIGAAVDALLAEGTIGEGGTGIRLRE